MKRTNYLALLGLAIALPMRAQAPASADTSVRVTIGGFVDGYYAWDAGRPPSFDRSFAGGAPFMTQPARHNEFNINLAFVEMKLEGARVRGRLAFQTGTSVQANYAGEPTSGSVSGPSVARLIQEAVVGMRLGATTWLDAGIFFSHIGTESWISRDNPTYTRSLVADYTPYYQSGVKLTWSPRATLTAQVDLVNGWQNISENNSGKGVGARLEWVPATGTTLSYYNFFSDESGSSLRSFHGVGAKVERAGWTWLAEADAGRQQQPVGAAATWYGLMATARRQLTTRVAASARAERFVDDHQIVLSTGTMGGGGNPAFHGNGFSVGLDVAPAPRVIWRTELRSFNNRDPVFPDGPNAARRFGGFAVTSLGVTF